MLKLTNIDLTLGKGSKLERPVLQKLNLSITPGEFVIVMGGNGAGKSTLFNVISGFLKPDAGQIILDGKDFTHTSQKCRAPWVAKVMQDPRLGPMENMTIFENMAFSFKRGQRRGLLPFSNRQRKTLFQEKLSMLHMGLEARLDECVSHLSGGQRQALSLIMAVISDSKILLLDEMCAALDPKMAETIMQLANTIIREEEKTCIMITHNIAHAIAYGDRLLILKEGKLMKEFQSLEKKQLTPSALAAEFSEV